MLKAVTTIARQVTITAIAVEALGQTLLLYPRTAILTLLQQPH
jgi:hypothetical protein